jgi:hypothetical protein
MHPIARSLRLVVVTAALVEVLSVHTGPGLAQTLPRDFTLPMPLFAPGSAWNQTATEAM